jgi:hypothetical protein
MEAKRAAFVVTGLAVFASAAVLYCSATITDGLIQLAAVATLFGATVVTVVVLACRRNRRTIWLVVPVLVLAAGAWLTRTDLPQRAMLGLISDDLQRIAAGDKPGSAGPYQIMEPTRKGTAVLLRVSGTGWIFSHEGFIYAPDGASTIPPLGEDYKSLDFWHLDGPWYGYHMQES